jgi:hypothetical protein
MKYHIHAHAPPTGLDCAIFHPTASVQHHHGNNDQDTVKIAIRTTSNSSPAHRICAQKANS